MSWYVGIDPGSRDAGLAALHENGDLRTLPLHATGEFPSRLDTLYETAVGWLSDIGDEGSWCCVIERPIARGTRNSNVLLASFGVLMLAARRTLACPILDLASASWKAAVCENGGRAKEEHVTARALQLGYTGANHDVAVAVCCAATARQLAEAQLPARSAA